MVSSASVDTNSISESAVVLPETSAASDMSSRKRKMKPPGSQERLEEKLDQLIADQAAARQQNEQQFKSMMDMCEKQHKERLGIMNKLVEAVAGKGKGKKRREEESGDSDS